MVPIWLIWSLLRFLFFIYWRAQEKLLRHFEEKQTERENRYHDESMSWLKERDAKKDQQRLETMALLKEQGDRRAATENALLRESELKARFLELQIKKAQLEVQHMEEQQQRNTSNNNNNTK